MDLDYGNLDSVECYDIATVFPCNCNYLSIQLQFETSISLLIVNPYRN